LGLHQCKSTTCLVTDKQIDDYNMFLIGFPVDPSESQFPRRSFKNQLNAVVTIENPIYRYPKLHPTTSLHFISTIAGQTCLKLDAVIFSAL
jgi:hypothetical protein